MLKTSVRGRFDCAVLLANTGTSNMSLRLRVGEKLVAFVIGLGLGEWLPASVTE
jgi:hypothetical protein